MIRIGDFSMKIISAVAVCFFAATLVVTAATSDVKNIIVNPGNAAALSSTTGLSPAESQSIIDQAGDVQINPEINIPADGATISGSGIVIRGVATPNASIDILIQPASGSGGPTFGKAVGDRYGVWSYTLAPRLENGSYTIQATAKAGNAAPRQSKVVRFSVLGSASPASSDQDLSGFMGLEGNSFLLIIIIAVIMSVTFIVTVIVLATAPYARGRRTGEVEQTRLRESPELQNMNDAQWKNFVIKTTAMRKYMKALSRGPLPSNR